MRESMEIGCFGEAPAEAGFCGDALRTKVAGRVICAKLRPQLTDFRFDFRLLNVGNVALQPPEVVRSHEANVLEDVVHCSMN